MANMNLGERIENIDYILSIKRNLGINVLYRSVNEMKIRMMEYDIFIELE